MISYLDHSCWTTTPHEIVDRIMHGDSEARELAVEMAKCLSIGCADAATLLNPQAIVLNGGIIDGFWGWPDFEKAVDRSCTEYAVRECASAGLVRSSFKTTASGSPALIIGASILPFETGFFCRPREAEERGAASRDDDALDSQSLRSNGGRFAWNG